MREDDLLGVVVELAEGDEAAALFEEAGAGDAEALGVGVDAGGFFLGEDAELSPDVELACSAGVDAFAAFGIEEFGQAEDDSNQVEGAALVVGLLLGGRDFVAGLGDDVFKADCGGIVTPCAKGIEASHLGIGYRVWGLGSRE